MAGGVRTSLLSVCHLDGREPVVQGRVEGGVVTDGETQEEDITGEQGGAGGQGLQGAGGGDVMVMVVIGMRSYLEEDMV